MHQARQSSSTQWNGSVVDNTKKLSDLTLEQLQEECKQQSTKQNFFCLEQLLKEFEKRGKVGLFYKIRMTHR